MLNVAFQAACALWPDRPTLVLIFVIVTCGYGLRRFVRLDPAQRNDVIRLFKAARRK